MRDIPVLGSMDAFFLLVNILGGQTFFSYLRKPLLNRGTPWLQAMIDIKTMLCSFIYINSSLSHFLFCNIGGPWILIGPGAVLLYISTGLSLVFSCVCGEDIESIA